MSAVIQTIALLILSNIFMTFAWYGHLKTLGSKPLWIAIAVSWGSHCWNIVSKFQRIASAITLEYPCA